MCAGHPNTNIVALGECEAHAHGVVGLRELNHIGLAKDEGELRAPSQQRKLAIRTMVYLRMSP